MKKIPFLRRFITHKFNDRILKVRSLTACSAGIYLPSLIITTQSSKGEEDFIVVTVKLFRFGPYLPSG